MRRLLWKEWQERRLWMALWVLIGVVTTVLGKGQRITNTYDIDMSWIMLTTAAAMLAGLGGYGSELHGERATFLYSRAITWKQILTAKLLLGVFNVVVSVIINAITGQLLLPVEYHPLVTPHSLVIGALIMAGFTGAVYLIGLACSTVLPGLAGSLLVLIGWFALGSSIDNFAYRGAMLGLISAVRGTTRCRLHPVSLRYFTASRNTTLAIQPYHVALDYTRDLA